MESDAHRAGLDGRDGQMAARPQDAPPLIVTPGYVGPDRRAPGLAGRLRRERFGRVCTVRGLLTLALAVVAVTAVVGVALSRARREPVGSALAASVHAARSIDAGHGRIARSASHVGSTVPPTTVPPPASAAASAPAPPALTPQQLGAEALALVRYPWQKLPGYSIEFEPSSDAPAPGFEGNTTFTWGQPGGTSVLYVFPGETVQQLAGITAFEIGHEVDAAAVEPQGGHTQIENILGIHPASWAPNCDCAEQGFLSGWYAAAFSDYWSPGVGQWSSLAPMPTGAVLAAVEPWLNPTVP